MVIPLSSSESLTLARRDLFDARFQLISESTGDEPEAPEGSRSSDSAPENEKSLALKFVDTPSDLVPGIYEGGLKIWECSLDLVNYLDQIRETDIKGKRLLEVCSYHLMIFYLSNIES